MKKVFCLIATIVIAVWATGCSENIGTPASYTITAKISAPMEEGRYHLRVGDSFTIAVNYLPSRPAYPVFEEVVPTQGNSSLAGGGGTYTVTSRPSDGLVVVQVAVSRQGVHWAEAMDTLIIEIDPLPGVDSHF